MHGGSWYLRNWLYAAAHAGWDAWAVNLRGHHGSRPVREVGRLSVLDYVEDVHDCLRTFREAVLIGHSMGGLVAQKAAEGGRVRAAVFVTSAAPKGIRILTWPLFWRMPRYAMAIATSQAFSMGPEDAAALVGNRLTNEERAWAYPQLVPESARPPPRSGESPSATDPSTSKRRTTPTCSCSSRDGSVLSRRCWRGSPAWCELGAGSPELNQRGGVAEPGQGHQKAREQDVRPVADEGEGRLGDEDAEG